MLLGPVAVQKRHLRLVGLSLRVDVVLHRVVDHLQHGREPGPAGDQADVLPAVGLVAHLERDGPEEHLVADVQPEEVLRHAPVALLLDDEVEISLGPVRRDRSVEAHDDIHRLDARLEARLQRRARLQVEL